jgi:hypothetical protein
LVGTAQTGGRPRIPSGCSMSVVTACRLIAQSLAWSASHAFAATPRRTSSGRHYPPSTTWRRNATPSLPALRADHSRASDSVERRDSELRRVEVATPWYDCVNDGCALKAPAAREPSPNADRATQHRARLIAHTGTVRRRAGLPLPRAARAHHDLTRPRATRRSGAREHGLWGRPQARSPAGASTCELGHPQRLLVPHGPHGDDHHHRQTPGGKNPRERDEPCRRIA